MRTYLSPGTVIPVTGEGATRKVYIERVIGEGASCIVYDGFFVDIPGVKERCRLKECYPLDAKIKREGTRLVWSDPEERLVAQKRFHDIRQISFKMRYNPEVGNHVTKSGYYENGDNFYLIMDINHGQTLDKEKTQDIFRILKITLMLTQLVGKFHSLNYRFLDLKPDNILVSTEPDPDIWLFDFDSLVSADYTHSVSYSKGWAAPELVQGKISSLCNATDLYSIGAILFYKVMGRPVTNDDIGLFADWDFEGVLFDDVNPKIKRILQTIFRKTLAASNRRRYQSTEELANALAVACEVASAKQFIVAPELELPAHFVGRDQEIKAIYNKFQEGNTAVFLHGIGGIGKSTLAVAYALSHKKSYDTVLFCRYKASLEDVLDDLVDEIQNFDGNIKEGRRKLQKILDENTLLIVDNFDVSTDKDPYLHQFLKLNAKLLFTSRTDFETLLPKTSAQLEVSALPHKQLETLFAGISGIQINTIEKEQHLSKLLQSVNYHTYITELLARQIVSSGWSIELLARKIEDGLNGLATAEKVQATKDDMSPKQTIPESLRVLFNLAALDDRSQQVLRNIYLLDGFVCITKDTYKLFCNSEIRSNETYYSYYYIPHVPESSADINVLNELCERGWIQKTHGQYTLHPLIAELILTDLVPCEGNCKKLYEYINAVLKAYSCFHEHDEADAREHRDYFELLCSFINHIDLSNSINREFAMKFLRVSINYKDTSVKWIESEIAPVEWLEEKEFKDIIAKIENITKKHQLTNQETFEFYLILFVRSMQIFDKFYVIDGQEEAIHTCYESALCAAKALPAEISQIAITRIHNEITEQLIRGNKQPKSFIQKVYKTNPEILDTGRDKEYYLEWYELIPEQRSVGILTERTLPQETLDHYAKLEAWEEQIDLLHEECKKAKDKRAFVQHLYSDCGLEIYQVVACLLEFCEKIFWRLSLDWGYKSEQIATIQQNTDWNGIRTILDFSEELQKSSKWQKHYDRYSLYDDEFSVCGDRTSISDTHLWRIQLAAACNDWISFDQLIKEGVWYPNNIYFAAACNACQPNDMSVLGNADPIWSVARTCWNLGVCHRVLPYLVMHVNREEKEECFNGRDSVTVYQNIVDIAQKACLEVRDGSPQYFEYQQIANAITSKIDQLTGKRYRLKKETQEQSN